MTCANSYTLGFWTGTLAPCIRYTDSHLIHHPSAIWSDDPEFARIDSLLKAGGDEAVSASVEEKRMAERLAAQSLIEIAPFRSATSPEHYLEYTGYFEEARQQARINRYGSRPTSGCVPIETHPRNLTKLRRKPPWPLVRRICETNPWPQIRSTRKAWTRRHSVRSTTPDGHDLSMTFAKPSPVSQRSRRWLLLWAP